MNILRVQIKITTKNKEDRKTLLSDFIDVLKAYDCFTDSNITYSHIDDEANIIAEIGK